MSSSPSRERAPAGGASLYRAVWRWHFYAGLFVLPFILILSVTGAIYLFKPQIDRWEERAFRDLPTAGAVSPDRQLAAALAAEPGARFTAYRLPEAPGDAAMIQLRRADGDSAQLFVSPQGEVLGTLVPDDRLSEVIATIHGSLLIGRVGDTLVELAASWAIVMILTGLYLWWPRPLRLAGTLWPRLSLRGRPLLKDLHRVIGFWIAGLVLVLLASGLPWAGTWGSAFAWVRAELGLVSGPQDWKIGVAASHAGHPHEEAPTTPAAATSTALPLSAFVARARAEDMPFPVMVRPPNETAAETVWTVKAEPQNRTLQRQVSYDPATGAEVARSGFADQHVIDRIVNTGVAWHEGQLFGWVNQLIGVLTALGLIAVSILGVMMWLRRRPEGRIGAPPASGPVRRRGPIVLLVVAGLLLPLFGASVLLVLAVQALARAMRRPVLSG